MYIGAAYYPEFYNQSRWKTDIELFVRAGFNVVRMGEFSWCRLEPKEGIYTFDWLDEVINMFTEKGVKIILGTPTGAPPQWLLDRYPDILPVDERGYRLQIGSFGVYCRNNPDFYRHIKNIVEAMVQHYKDNDNIIMYQIDNEIPAYPCYCDNCKQEFRKWVEDHHKSIEQYNKNLMTIFQGRELDSFDQIFIPTKSRASNPPALISEYSKFMSDSSVKYCKYQADIIRAIDKHKTITTNYDCYINTFDHFKMGKLLDVIGMDVYPKGDSQFDLEANSMLLDFTRSIGKGNKFWILEQQCSPIAFKPINYQLAPNEILLYTANSIAHGADNIVYFRFNATHNGGERFGAGILRHDNKPNRTYKEICDVVNRFHNIEHLIDNSNVKQPKVGIVYSYKSRWCIHTPKAMINELSYDKEVEEYYHYCFTHNIMVDFVEPLAKLDNYDIILAPMYASITEEEAKWLEKYVRCGKIVVVGALSGIYNEYNEITSEYYQGKLKTLLGIEVEDYYIPYNKNKGIVIFDNKKFDKTELNMLIHPISAKEIAVYESDFYKGVCAISANNLGKGCAYYYGLLGDASLLETFLDKIFAKYINERANVICNSVRIVTRITKDREIVFIMNADSASYEVQLLKQYTDMLTGKELNKVVEIKEKETLILSRILTND